MQQESLAKGYTLGTHRLVAPEVTLERIRPLLAGMGITRLADITGLDRLGIPTFCAIRPTARLVQTANGKGLSEVDARVSALMESVEVFHAEEPRLPTTRASLTALRKAGRNVVDPRELPHFQATGYYNGNLIIDWVEAWELHSETRWLLPASAAYPTSPSQYLWSTNGLASGNHLIEATLHALYEVVERHALALAVQPESNADSDVYAVLRPSVKYFRLATINSPPVMQLCERVAQADLTLQLAAVKSPGRVHTMWAILLDKRPLAMSTLVNAGYGTHASPTVAAIRAITEAAQSRLSMIHASREDLADKGAFTDSEQMTRAYAHFDGLICGGHWPFLKDTSAASLNEDYANLLAALAAEGVGRIYRVDLTRQPFDIPVVKVIVPGFRMDHRMV